MVSSGVKRAISESFIHSTVNNRIRPMTRFNLLSSKMPSDSCTELVLSLKARTTMN